MASFFKNLFRKDEDSQPVPAAPLTQEVGAPARPPVFPEQAPMNPGAAAVRTGLPGNTGPFSAVSGRHMTAREIAALLPPGLLRYDGISPDQPVALPLDFLRQSMQAGRPVLRLSQIQQACPPLFLRAVDPAEDVEITLPVARVKGILEFSAPVGMGTPSAGAASGTPAAAPLAAGNPFATMNQPTAFAPPSPFASVTGPVDAVQGNPFAAVNPATLNQAPAAAAAPLAPAAFPSMAPASGGQGEKPFPAASPFAPAPPHAAPGLIQGPPGQPPAASFPAQPAMNPVHDSSIPANVGPVGAPALTGIPAPAAASPFAVAAAPAPAAASPFAVAPAAPAAAPFPLMASQPAAALPLPAGPGAAAPGPFVPATAAVPAGPPALSPFHAAAAPAGSAPAPLTWPPAGAKPPGGAPLPIQPQPRTSAVPVSKTASIPVVQSSSPVAAAASPFAPVQKATAGFPPAAVAASPFGAVAPAPFPGAPTAPASVSVAAPLAAPAAQPASAPVRPSGFPVPPASAFPVPAAPLTAPVPALAPAAIAALPSVESVPVASVPVASAPVPVSDGVIELSLRAILRDAVPVQLGFVPDNVPESVRATLSLDRIVPQLAAGRVEVGLDEVVAGISEKFRPAFSRAQPGLRIVIPMSEVFHNLPESARPGLDASSPLEAHLSITTSPFQTPFAIKAEEDSGRQLLDLSVTGFPAARASASQPVQLPAPLPPVQTLAAGPPAVQVELPVLRPVANGAVDSAPPVLPSRPGALSRPPGSGTAPTGSPALPPPPKSAPRLKPSLPPVAPVRSGFPKPSAPPPPGYDNGTSSLPPAAVELPSLRPAAGAPLPALPPMPGLPPLAGGPPSLAAPTLAQPEALKPLTMPVKTEATDAADDLGESFSAAKLGTEPPPRAGSVPVFLPSIASGPIASPAFAAALSPITAQVPPATSSAPVPATLWATGNLPAPVTVPVPVAELAPSAPAWPSLPPTTASALVPPVVSSVAAFDLPVPAVVESATEPELPVEAAAAADFLPEPFASSPVQGLIEPEAPVISEPLASPVGTSAPVPVANELPALEATVPSFPAAPESPVLPEPLAPPPVLIAAAPVLQAAAPMAQNTSPVPAVPLAQAAAAPRAITGPLEDLTFGCISDLRQLTLRAVLGTEQALTPQDIVDRCAALPGLKACVLLRPDNTIVSQGMDGAAAGAFLASAAKTRDSLAVLAETMGLGSGGNFTLRTDLGIRSFFLEENLCLAVWHAQPQFSGGTREKLILIAQELAKA